MQRKQPHQEFASHNIMAAILQNLPSEAELTKIEYEGPRIALYSKNPGYLLKNAQVVSNMVNTIKKRIVIRIDESLRKPEHEAIEFAVALHFGRRHQHPGGNIERDGLRQGCRSQRSGGHGHRFTERAAL